MMSNDLLPLFFFLSDLFLFYYSFLGLVWLQSLFFLGTPLCATAYRAVTNEAVKRPILFFFFVGIIDREKKLIRHPSRLEGKEMGGGGSS
jgi:hypothetical protein